MAGSVNKVILVGNLGRDPEIRMTNSGQKVANLSLATSERWKDRDSGEQQEKTEWHRVVIFNDNLADVAERFLKKGSKIYVEGQLQTRKWTDQMGQEKYSTEVILNRFKGELNILDSRSEGMGSNNFEASNFNQASNNSGSQAADPTSQAPVSYETELDDEIPF